MHFCAFLQPAVSVPINSIGIDGFNYAGHDNFYNTIFNSITGTTDASAVAGKLLKP